MNSSLKWVLGCLVPHSAVTLRHQIHRRRAVAVRRATRLEFDASEQAAYDYENSIAWLVSQGLDEDQVREGSMPERSLEFIGSHLWRFLQPGPVNALHIGNFVGVSLAYLTRTLQEIDETSMIIAIDPNIPHRGIASPQNHAARLLSRYGLQKNAMLVCGYSLSKTQSDDGGYIYSSAHMSKERFATEAASENVLPNLGRLLPFKVDCAFIDGNHDGSYLTAELTALGRLVRPGGLLVLDDVSEAWFEIGEVFERFKKEHKTRTFQDGRVGIIVLD